jgi:hypothetical protein
MAMLFLVLDWILSGQQKARQRLRRRALVSSDLSGRLRQAMAVRRHGFSMMVVVMGELAAALHLMKP